VTMMYCHEENDHTLVLTISAFILMGAKHAMLSLIENWILWSHKDFQFECCASFKINKCLDIAQHYRNGRGPPAILFKVLRPTLE
jgi:hypothetical protein